MINKAYVLTEGEKSRLISQFRDGNPTLLRILEIYKRDQNTTNFYDLLRENQFLSFTGYSSVS